MAAFTQAILALRLDDLSDIRPLLPSVVTATRQTTQRLVVILFCDAFNDDAGLNKLEAWGVVQTALTAVYVEATRVAYEEDRILMDVDVLFNGTDSVVPQVVKEDVWEALFRAEADNLDLLLPPWTTSLQHVNLDPIRRPGPNATSSRSGSSSKESTSSFPVVALGGTFDHLHSGHKILLSMAAWIADNKLIVGVTDDVLLQKKSYKEMLETLDVRIARVRAFLNFFKPGLFYDIVPINDVYGPTAVDPNIQALVVSKETESGAASIAKKREESSLPALECFVIDVVSTTSANLDAQDMDMLRQTKLSSTFIREYLATRSSREL